MIIFMLIIGMAATSAIAAVTVAFSPSRAILAVSAVVLSFGLSVLGVLVMDVRSIFWVAPTYFLLDIVTLYFLFTTVLQSDHAQQILKREKFKYIIVLFSAMAVFAMGSWAIWRMSEGSLPALTDSGTPIHLLLWDSNLPLVLLCFLLLAPAAIGALLMVRMRDQ